MGEARRRRLIAETDRREQPVRYSEPWPCPNCSNPDELPDDVVYEIRAGWARCPRCGYGNRREAFGFVVAELGQSDRDGEAGHG